jgi:hypothetical protein
VRRIEVRGLKPLFAEFLRDNHPLASFEAT